MIIFKIQLVLLSFILLMTGCKKTTLTSDQSVSETDTSSESVNLVDTTVTFSGYTWQVKTSDNSTVGPGPNYWNHDQVRVDSNGWLQNTVNPYTFTTPTNASAGAVSPEGQAFVLLMHAAWRDYVQYVITNDTVTS